MKALLHKVNDLITEKICSDCGNDAAMFMVYNEEDQKAGVAFRGTRGGLEDMLLSVLDQHEDIRNILLEVMAFDYRDEVLNIINTTKKMERDN